MAREKANTSRERQKVIGGLILLLIVGYIYSRPTLERWTGTKLPAFGTEAVSQRGDSVDGSSGRGENSGRNGSPETAHRNSSTSGNPKPDIERTDERQTGTRSTRNSRTDSPSPDGSSTPTGKEFFFESIGRNTFRSPAGLIYGMGPAGEHRRDHVLKHLIDAPSRPVHGVFSGSDNEVFGLIDQSYRLALKGGKNVQVEREGDRTEYTVRMPGVVGYEGGQSGRRNNYPGLNRIKLIVEDGDRIITAYPCR